MVGVIEGSGVGERAAYVGDAVKVGKAVGVPGTYVGAEVGLLEGARDGAIEGNGVGDPAENVGDDVDCTDGDNVGLPASNVGAKEGVHVGRTVGRDVGLNVGLPGE